MDSSQLEFRTRRFKLIWRGLMISNLALGAYLFSTVRKDKSPKGKETKTVAITVTKEHLTAAEDQQPNLVDQKPSHVTTTPVKEQAHQLVSEDQHLNPVTTTPFFEEVAHEPIPEDQQCVLFNWMLEEKRKAKPKEYAEKKRINEETAILEQNIRLKSIPSSVITEQVRPAIPEYLKSNPEDQHRMLFSWILEQKRQSETKRSGGGEKT